MLQAKVALSTVSIEGAYRNMDSELAHWNFNQVKEGSSKRWEDILSRVEIEGSVEQKETFIHPCTISFSTKQHGRCRWKISWG